MKSPIDLQTLEQMLNLVAGPLGMTVRVAPIDDAFRVEATLPCKAQATIDDEMFYNAVYRPLNEPITKPSPLVDLLMCTIDNLQDDLHAFTAAHLATTNRRGKYGVLTSDEKHLLHDILIHAERELRRDWCLAQQNMKKIDTYRTLVGKLLK